MTNLHLKAEPDIFVCRNIQKIVICPEYRISVSTLPRLFLHTFFLCYVTGTYIYCQIRAMNDISTDLALKLKENVWTFQDLIKMCSVNKRFKMGCDTFKKSILKAAVQKRSFRQSYFDLFRRALREANVDNFKKVIDWYPVGDMWEERYDFMNRCQVELLTFPQRFFSDIDEDFLINNDYTIQLLFFPSHYIEDVLNSYEVLYHVYNGLESDSVVKANFFNVCAFHMKKLYNFSNHIIFHKTVCKVIKDYFAEFDEVKYAGESETTVEYIEFGINLCKVYYAIDEEHTKVIIAASMFYSNDDFDINSEDMKDMYGWTWEYLKQMYDTLGLADVEDSKANRDMCA